jgi:hypothetical protein
MKFVKVDSGEIGLLVELPTGPHVVDIAKSLGVFAHDLVSGGLINGTLKEQCAWAALVNNWPYLRMPFELLARMALANPGDQRLVLYPCSHARQTQALHGIVALDITHAADLETHDPTGRLVMARQFGEPVVEHAERSMPPMGENVQVIDFSRHSE